MRLRLLLADDAPFIREVLRHALDGTDIELVGEACDGQEVVDLALTLKPDVIIMDLVMPIKSGVVATTEILEQLPETRIIGCSTVDQQDMVLKALEAGCCDYMTKPFQREVVIDRVRATQNRNFSLKPMIGKDKIEPEGWSEMKKNGGSHG